MACRWNDLAATYCPVTTRLMPIKSRLWPNQLPYCLPWGWVPPTFLYKALVVLMRRLQQYGPQRLRGQLNEEVIFAYLGKVRINGLMRLLEILAGKVAMPGRLSAGLSGADSLPRANDCTQ